MVSAANAMGNVFKAMAQKPATAEESKFKAELGHSKMQLQEKNAEHKHALGQEQFSLLRDELELRKSEAENEKLRLQIELERLRQR